MPLIRITEPDKTTRIGIWKITESTSELKSVTALTADEEQAWSSFKSESRKKQWLAARRILALMHEKQHTIIYNEQGKPALNESDTHISITHSRDMAAVITRKDRPAGIDVERITDRIERVKERFLPQEELDRIGDNDRLEKLYILWGIRECLFKTAGNPHLDYRSDIKVEPFDYLCNNEGRCEAWLNVAGSPQKVKLAYEKIEDYLLVYTL